MFVRVALGVWFGAIVTGDRYRDDQAIACIEVLYLCVGL